MADGRGEWKSRIGFVMAAAGSAVGLGNIWKFPYMTGENGGAAFLVVYLVLVFTIGISVMLAEISTGGGHAPAWAPAWQVICRYIAPAVIVWILFSGL